MIVSESLIENGEVVQYVQVDCVPWMSTGQKKRKVNRVSKVARIKSGKKTDAPFRATRERWICCKSEL
jgi:hypothetical protein